MREPGAPSVDKSVDYCSGCGICTLVCPHGVKVMEINTQAKAAMVQTHGISLRNWFLGRNEVWGRLGTPLAPVLNFAMGNRRPALDRREDRRGFGARANAQMGGLYLPRLVAKAPAHRHRADKAVQSPDPDEDSGVFSRLRDQFV
jgi:ferredoxin